MSDVVRYPLDKLLKCIILLQGEEAGLWTLSAEDEEWIASVVGHELGAGG